MRRILISLVLLMLLSILSCPLIILADEQLTEQEALDILVEQIKKDNLYVHRISLSCLQFIMEEETETYFDFAIYEKHGGECPGDSNTSPIADRFRIERNTKEILWYDVIMADYMPYDNLLETINN